MDSLIVDDFSLSRTLKSGHIFAFQEVGVDEFVVHNGDFCFLVKQVSEGNNSVLRFSGISEADLIHFFDLDRTFDFLADHRDLSAFKHIRLVRQDLRQAILTFIMTANNNQKRIKKMMDSFCAEYGEDSSIGQNSVSLFPQQSANISETRLRELGFGYRAKSIVGSNLLVTQEFVEQVLDSSYDDARRSLLTLPGVGPKVADCILAYSEYASSHAFPVDVWVRRAMERRYPTLVKQKKRSYDQLGDFARNKFGENTAYIQHYFFLAEQELSKK